MQKAIIKLSIVNINDNINIVYIVGYIFLEVLIIKLSNVKEDLKTCYQSALMKRKYALF